METRCSALPTQGTSPARCGPNSGGNELLARQVAAWFVAGTRTYAKNRYRERAGKDGFGPVLERQIEGRAERSTITATPMPTATPAISRRWRLELGR